MEPSREQMTMVHEDDVHDVLVQSDDLDFE